MPRVGRCIQQGEGKGEGMLIKKRVSLEARCKIESDVKSVADGRI